MDKNLKELTGWCDNMARWARHARRLCDVDSRHYLINDGAARAYAHAKDKVLELSRKERTLDHTRMQRMWAILDSKRMYMEMQQDDSDFNKGFLAGIRFALEQTEKDEVAA